MAKENNPSRIVLSLGAHRAGTSLVTAAIEAAGAELALSSRPVNEENKKGFFEHVGIVALDDALLRSAGSAWDDGLFKPQDLGRIPSDELKALRAQAAQLVMNDLRPAPLAAVKDPRMCRLLPFWLPILEAAGYAKRDISYVLITRDPVESALSQQHRCEASPAFYNFGRDLAEGAVLWLSHMRQVLHDFAGQRALVVSYRDLLERPQQLMENLSDFLQLSPDHDAVDRFVSEFITDDLWRSRADDLSRRQVEAVFPGLTEAEQALAAFSGQTIGTREVNSILGKFDIPQFETATRTVVARAYGRLAGLRRDESLQLRRLTSALDTANERLVGSDNEIRRLENALNTAQEDAVETGNELRQLKSALEAANECLVGNDDELRRLQRDNEFLKQANDAIRASRSWKVTLPLRAVGGAARTLATLPQRRLRKLNETTHLTYRWMKSRHPRMAELIRRIVQPLVVRANMAVLGQHTVPMPPAERRENSDRAFLSAYQQVETAGEFRPLVSIIVPNFNHGVYLSQRLESIYAQTYENFEVLLLDDCSSDDSRQILADFAARYPDRTRTLFNDINSGSVFRQWEKGFRVARGELVWVAESDDWASPNFLETLVPFFQNEAVQLAFAPSVFMDAAGEKQIWAMEQYLHQFGAERWSRAWVETAPDIVRDVFSMANIIPNASSALFRRFERLDTLEIEQWRDMRTCGDWMFYLNVIRGGLLAYSPEAQSFYRIHDKNTSVDSHTTDRFYREHEEVAKCVRRHYKVPEENLARMEENLRRHWKLKRDGYSDEAFGACFDRTRILAAPERKPALLMAGYAFCAGGGETFPIQLANEMKAIGYEVTFLDCAQEARVDGVRARLANDIPVLGDFRDLCRIVQDFDIDVIHSHHGWVDNTVLDLLPEDIDCRTVITLHGFYETVPLAQRKRILPRLLRRTSAMVYVAEKNLAAVREAKVPASGRLHRIDNAVSTSRTDDVTRAGLGIEENAFVLTLVSRALHSKGWTEAIAATTRARELVDRDIHLILVGEGEAKDAAEAAGVPAYVHIEGFRSNPQDYFALADIGFLPSRFKGESFPLVVIESLISGTPVLASNVGEISYMLDTASGSAGVLFELENDGSIDTEALARRIAALAVDPEEMRRLRKRVSNAASAFDPERMARSYDHVYQIAVRGDAFDKRDDRMLGRAGSAR